MKQQRCSDAELVLLFQQGSENAFEELLNRHKDRVFTTICYIVKDRCKAEDLLQETFIKAVRVIKSGEYKDVGKFLPWISRIAFNFAIDWFRSNKKNPEVLVEDGIDYYNSENLSEDLVHDESESLQSFRDNQVAVRRYIQMLPRDQRDVLIMRHYMDLSFKEISEKMGVGVSTSVGRMRYALINLKKQLSENTLGL